MTVFQSAQHFVRALKGPSDPPVAQGPLKISIAEQAWHDQSFYLPNKAEVIADWLLSKFFRERGEGVSTNALASERYWKLLSSVLYPNDAPSSPTSNTVAWLKPILGRIAIVPIVSAFLNLWPELEPSQSANLLEYTSRCISLLYPLGTQKLTTEALLEAWGTFLKNSGPFVNELSAIKIGAVLTKVYGDSLSNSSNRKKLNSSFVQSAAYFNTWLERLRATSTPPQYEYLRQSILSVGVETIFNLDTLRQISESPDGTLLFNALETSLRTHRTTVLKSFPELYTHYVSCLKRHRGAIFTQSSTSQAGSSRTEFNVAAMKFFTCCQNMLDSEQRDGDAWDTISGLAEVVGQENLYDSQSDTLSSLKSNVSVALDYLAESWKGPSQATIPIVRCLSAITRVDYDLVLPSMGQLLSRLLMIPETHPDYFTFLDSLLEFHIKTRTVNQYLETLLSCLSAPSTSLQIGARECYAICLSGPILHPKHLEKVSKATQQFLTPSQCNTALGQLCEAIKTLKEAHKTAERQRDADLGKGSRKARKSDAMIVEQKLDPESITLAFALSSKLAQTVLGSLPISSVPQHQAEQIRSIVVNFQTEFVEPGLSKLLKGLTKSEDGDEVKGSKRKAVSGNDTWGTQIVLVSFLRLRYTLGMAKYLSLPESAAPKLPKRLLSLLSQDDGELLPELTLEIVRTLLDQAFTMEPSEVSSSIDHTLQLVDKRLSPHMATTWSGSVHELTFGEMGQALSGLAVLHLVLERWLPVIDMSASEHQLQKLAKILSRIPLDFIGTPQGPSGKQSLGANHLLFRALRSAQFWELHNLRTALLAHLEEVTSTLDKDQPSPEKISRKSKKGKQSGLIDISQVVSTYRLLLFFPVEYFTKSCRSDLVKRAIKADWSISHGLEKDSSAEEEIVGLSVVRTFLKRTFSFLGSIEQQSSSDVADFILHLLTDIPTIGGRDDYQTTLDLCELYFAELFRQAARGDAGEASKVISSYLQYPIFDNLSSIKPRSLVLIVELLNRDFGFSSFSPDIQASFQGLHARLATVLQEKINVVLSVEDTTSLQNVPALLTYWHAVLSLGQWVGAEASTFFGTQLVNKFNLKFLSIQEIFTGEWTDKTAVMVIAILLQELRYRDEMAKNDQLNVVVAAYVAYRRVLSPSGQTEQDDFISKACRQLSPASFEHVLSLLEEAISKDSNASTMATDLVHLASVLLRDHPPNTLRIMQAFFTSCLDIFTNHEEFTAGAVELRIQTLDIVVQHCSERPAALRSLDMGNTWALLSKYLSPSAKHDKATTTAIFHKIIGIVNAVIRLRRDLVSPMLPHLGMILRQLILSMRQCRSQLASKQTDMVMSTQPRWISAAQSLGVEEARSLSRLLETLTTKTITRVHATSTETQKAESLAAPFSKHAAFVLKAYIEAMNDPLCVLTLDVRKELYSGLYALCSMIGEHSRDAMMVSALDAGGKATLKTLWKEYEKQRYVGRG
ncbi:hypothetical protein D9611_003253 [Ephemerocybe angulata]|uniref:Nucleolar 27S pre-rRNA processing Urb2/Npa2 C-terminal domain-containing protein n=1 Tax=Ephemerocybe angulata TaxID=980116 RepID=A0A8H5FI37_9AGAR|nr:hypothetical protein D9611_003253 [Tulosesus angulatus]